MTARVLNTDAAACERDLTKSRGDNLSTSANSTHTIHHSVDIIQHTTLQT